MAIICLWELSALVSVAQGLDCRDFIRVLTITWTGFLVLSGSRSKNYDSNESYTKLNLEPLLRMGCNGCIYMYVYNELFCRIN